MNKREKDRRKGKGGAVGNNPFITGKVTKNFTALNVPRQCALVFLVKVG